MKRLLLLIALAAANTHAFAEGSFWKCSSILVTGNTAQEVKEILGAHYWDFTSEFIDADASELAGLPIDKIVSVSIEQVSCNWIGPTVCKANGPKLNLQFDLPSGCYASGACWITNASMPGGDPCNNPSTSITKSKKLL